MGNSKILHHTPPKSCICLECRLPRLPIPIMSRKALYRHVQPLALRQALNADCKERAGPLHPSYPSHGGHCRRGGCNLLGLFKCACGILHHFQGVARTRHALSINVAPKALYILGSLGPQAAKSESP